jgi:competence protein ComEC
MSLRVVPEAGALVYLAGAWLLGVVAGAAAGEVWWPAVAAIGAAGLAAAALERRPQTALLGLLAAGLFVAGAVRYVDQRPAEEPGGVAVYNDGAPVRLRALAVDEPDVRGRTQHVRLQAREVFDPSAPLRASPSAPLRASPSASLRAGGERWQPASGGVLLRDGLFPRHHYGDLLELAGELETPPSFPDFDYRDYLARQGIISIIAYPEVRTIATGEGNRALEALHSARRHLGDALERALPEPQAALAQGIFLGQRSAIPPDLTDDLNATGTSHLVAISGQNVSLVAGLAISGLAWLIGRRQAALVALAAIVGYTVLTGASPTVVRAAIMGGLFVLATLVGRPASAATSIALAAAIMTGLDPPVVLDVSFQLSFAAITGLVYLTPAFQTHGAELLRRWGVEAGEGGVGSFLLESASVTAGAVAAALPLIALHFGRVSAVGLVSNLVLVPAFPLILVSSALTAAAGVVWAPLGEATGWFAWAMLSYMIEVARAFAAVPLASFEIDGFGRWHAAAAYVALAALTWWLSRRPPTPVDEHIGRTITTGRRFFRPSWVVAGCLAVAAAVAWWVVLDGTSGDRLTVSVLDVGQGDAILVETPDGQRLLIDGGARGRALAEALGEELPFWERTLDLVALTHPQEDHLNGLIEALERYDVRQVLATPLEADTAAYREWRGLIRREEVPYHEAQPGEWIDLGGGARLWVLGPGPAALASSEPNSGSLVLKLTWGRASFLLTGDIEVAAEEALLSAYGGAADGLGLRSTVLKVPHHGSSTSSSPAFVRAVQPAVAVVSVGEENPYGHPSPIVLDRLDGSLLFRTDRHGTVRLSTDGERLWVDVEGAEDD